MNNMYGDMPEKLISYIDSNGNEIPEGYELYDIYDGIRRGLCVFCGDISSSATTINLEVPDYPGTKHEVTTCPTCQEYLDTVYQSDWFPDESIVDYVLYGHLYKDDLHHFYNNGGCKKDQCGFCEKSLLMTREYSGQTIDVCSDNQDIIGTNINVCNRCAFYIEHHEEVGTAPKRSLDKCGSCKEDMWVMSTDYYDRQRNGTEGCHTCNYCIINDKFIEPFDDGYILARPVKTCINCRSRYTEHKSLYYGNNPFYDTIGKCPECHKSKHNNFVTLKTNYNEPMFLDLISLDSGYTFQFRDTKNEPIYMHKKEDYPDIGTATIAGLNKLRTYQ